MGTTKGYKATKIIGNLLEALGDKKQEEQRTQELRAYKDEQEERKWQRKIEYEESKANSDWMRKQQQQEQKQSPLRDMFFNQQSGQNLTEQGQYADPKGSGTGQAASYPGGQAPYGENAAVKDPFGVSTSPQPKVKYGKKGLLESYSPDVKEQIFDRIQEKESRNFPLTKKETKFRDKYLDVDVKKNQKDELREDLKEVLAKPDMTFDEKETEKTRLLAQYPLMRSEIEESLGKEKEPSWKQQATIDSVKADLDRGSGSTYSLMGEPISTEFNDLEGALNYLSKKNLPPEMFADELRQYGYQGQQTQQADEGRITVEDQQGNQFTLPMEQLDEAIKQGYKQVQ